MLTGKSAVVLFSFKRIYNILFCVKQVLGAVVANFLGEFIGKPGCQVGGLISMIFIGWTVGGDPYSNFGKLAPLQRTQRTIKCTEY